MVAFLGDQKEQVFRVAGFISRLIITLNFESLLSKILFLSLMIIHGFTRPFAVSNRVYDIL